jgi:hypothetical protein
MLTLMTLGNAERSDNGGEGGESGAYTGKGAAACGVNEGGWGAVGPLSNFLLFPASLSLSY